MPRYLFLATLLIFLTAGCSSQSAQTSMPTVTPSPPPKVTLLPSITPLPPTPTVQLVGSPTPTPLPTDKNSLKALLRSQAESANQGQHLYSYDCYAWAPCTCLIVVPVEFEITFDFSARSVDLRAGDYSQTYLWSTANAYSNSLGALATQLTFFEDGFELYTVIDNRSCMQERYTLQPGNP